MPVILVYGIPPRDPSIDEETDGHRMGEMHSQLIKTVISVKELYLNEEDISVFYPLDRIKEGLGEEIIIFVEGLFRKTKRTLEVKNELAGAICDCIAKYYPETRTIECFVRTFNQKTEGFHTIRRS